MNTSNTSKQYYLGIDPSARSSGLALVTILDGKPHDWDCTTIIPYKDMTGGARLHYIYETAKEFLQHRGVITLTRVCIESASLQSTNRETVLSEVRGIFLLLTYQLGACEAKMIAPTLLKQFVTGTGSATKEEVFHTVTSLGYWNPKNDDEADACGLANIAVSLDHTDKAPLTRPQLELVLRILQGKPLKAKLVKPKQTFDV